MALNINIEDTRYDNAISKMEGYVTELEGIVDKYTVLNTDVTKCYNSDATQELRKLIQTEINNLNQSIGATNLNIERFRSIKEQATITNSSISGSINAVLAEAESLFN